MFTFPEPLCTVDAAMDDGAVIRLRRHGNPDGSRIVLSHGNGLAIDGYFPFWSLLAADFEVVVFDFRNYGQSPRAPAGTDHGYDRFVADLGQVYDAIDDAFGRKPQIGAFHSMSSRANLCYALEVAWRLDGLVLFDPPMVPPPGHALYELMARDEALLRRWSASRQEIFDHPDELAAYFRGSRMLAGWVDGAYELMARALLREDAASGKWRLACPGALESEVYRQNALLNIWPDAGALPGPAMLIASDPDSDIPSAPGHACRALRDECGWRYACVPGTGHFLQIQEPAACRDILLGFCREIGFV